MSFDTVQTPKAAVIGTGWIAEHGHMPAYKKAGVEVIAVSDVIEERAQAVAASYGVPSAYAGWREMLATEKPDVVSVCVPNVYHAEITLAALAAGAHVLCEKPIATSVDEARSMFAAAAENRRFLMADQNTRFKPENQRLMRAIGEGLVGDIYHVESVYERRLGIPGWGSFTKKSASFGGALCDIGVHALDLAQWLMGNPAPVSVSATVGAHFGSRPEIAALRDDAWDAATFDVDDFAAVFVRYETGASVILRSSWAAHIAEPKEYIRIWGTEGGLTNDPPTLFSFREGKDTDDALETTGEKTPGWNEAVAHFIDVVRGDAEPMVREEQTMNVQRMINAAYESGASGREVDLRGG